MKNIYKGPLRKLVVSHLEIQDGVIQRMEYETPIVRKDLTFYRGLMNTYISFDFGTRLPDKTEALDFVVDTSTRRKITEAPFPECLFVDEREIEYSHPICDDNFKVLKKYYRQLRKEEKKK